MFIMKKLMFLTILIGLICTALFMSCDTNNESILKIEFETFPEYDENLMDSQIPLKAEHQNCCECTASGCSARKCCSGTNSGNCSCTCTHHWFSGSACNCSGCGSAMGLISYELY